MVDVVIKPEPDDPLIVKCCVCGESFDVDCDDIYHINTQEDLWICDNCLNEIRRDQ